MNFYALLCLLAVGSNAFVHVGTTAKRPSRNLFVSHVNDESATVSSKIKEAIGKVDDSWVEFDQSDNGDVPPPQLLSKEPTMKHSVGNWVGYASLVAGTTIGVGMLALPAATSPAGVIPSTLAVIVGYIYMTLSGLLIAELTLNRLAQGKTKVGVLELYRSALGPVGGTVGSIAYLFLCYSVMMACIAQGAHIWGVSGLAFAGAIAGTTFSIPKETMETMNNVLMVGLLGSFAAIVGLGAPTADIPSLFDPSLQHFDEILGCFPIIFLSFVFQNNVPGIVETLEGNRSEITKAIVAGTSLPLVMFLTWNAVVLGNAGHMVSGADPLALLQANGGDTMGSLIVGFSTLALVTSTVGFADGLFDSWKDLLDVSDADAEKNWKPILFALAFLPPTALAYVNPDSFQNALEYGGTFGVSTLFLVLPPLMVWKERYQSDTLLNIEPMVPFGKLPLGSMWKAAGTLIVEQGAEKLGVFDYFSRWIS